MNRDITWQLIRTLKTFTVNDIELASRKNKRISTLERSSIKNYCQCLVKAKYLSSHSSKNERHYLLIKDIGINAPNLKSDGTEIMPSKIHRLWQSMRILKAFNVDGLLSTSNTHDSKNWISTTHANNYLRDLTKAGYLKATKADNNITHYLLLQAMNTGPKAPKVQRIKHVFDPNLNKIVWPKSEEE
jgi:hypothetical protein